jgi:hypothetical protein
LNHVRAIHLTLTIGSSLKYASLLNVILVVAVAVGFAFYWPLQRELTSTENEERQLRDEYALFELSSEDLEQYHFHYQPAAKPVHPVLNAKFVKSYRWSIRVPDQGYRFSNGATGGGGDLNHIDASVTFIVRPTKATVFFRRGYSGGGGTLSSNQGFNEFLITNWDRLDTEICAQHQNVTSDLEFPKTLLKLAFSDELLADRPFYHLAIQDPNRAEAINGEDTDE